MKFNKVYLASASPRRQQLLDQVGIGYIVIKPDVDEAQLGEHSPEAYTRRLALSKALEVKNQLLENEAKQLPIIAADTAVAVLDKILGKPDNFEHAREMLMLLSGRTHQVFSSICVIDGEFTQTVTQVSQVSFRKISEAEIISYWDSKEPVGKAGAYAIQGRAAEFISSLSGSYSGVMGLPLYELMRILTNIPDRDFTAHGLI